MKIENTEKAIILLNEYYHNKELLKKAEETRANVAVLFDKIKDTNNDAEQFQYRKEIVDSIQKIISISKRDWCNFEYDVLALGFGIATTNLEFRVEALKQKIEKL